MKFMRLFWRSSFFDFNIIHSLKIILRLFLFTNFFMTDISAICISLFTYFIWIIIIMYSLYVIANNWRKRNKIDDEGSAKDDFLLIIKIFISFFRIMGFGFLIVAFISFLSSLAIRNPSSTGINEVGICLFLLCISFALKKIKVIVEKHFEDLE